MKVSIIVRTYNRAYILAEALESALRQTFQDFEIIVVDDASTDDTRGVVQSFKDERIRLLRHETNRGVGAACNTGIEASKGELIAWLDSDDTWTANKLELQVRFLASHPEIGAVFSDMAVADGADRHPSLIRLLRVFPRLLASKPAGQEYLLEEREMTLCLLEEVPIKPSTLLIRRRVVDTIGKFDGTSRSGEDWEFLLRLSHRFRFGFIDLPLALQRWLPDATHQRLFEEDRTYLLGVFLREKATLKSDPVAIGVVNEVIANFATSLAYRYLCSGKRGKAIETYLRGFKETGKRKMLFKALAATLPLNARAAVLRIVRTIIRSKRRKFY